MTYRTTDPHTESCYSPVKGDSGQETHVDADEPDSDGGLTDADLAGQDPLAVVVGDGLQGQHQAAVQHAGQAEVADEDAVEVAAQAGRQDGQHRQPVTEETAQGQSDRNGLHGSEDSVRVAVQTLAGGTGVDARFLHDADAAAAADAGVVVVVVMVVVVVLHGFRSRG